RELQHRVYGERRFGCDQRDGEYHDGVDDNDRSEPAARDHRSEERRVGKGGGDRDDHGERDGRGRWGQPDDHAVGEAGVADVHGAGGGTIASYGDDHGDPGGGLGRELQHRVYGERRFGCDQRDGEYHDGVDDNDRSEPAARDH